MSPDPKPQTRKRGRPANASKSADASASQDHPDKHEADNEESARSKQRGRPKKQKQEDATEETVAQEDKPRKKRGRPATEDKNAEKTTQDAAQPKKGRGRLSLEENQDEQELEQEEAENSIQGKRKRGRPSLEKNKDDNEPEQAAVDKEAQPKRKRGHAKKYPDGQEPEHQVAENEVQPRRKRGRRSLENDQNERETEKEMAKYAAQAKKRRGRPLEKDQNEAVDNSAKPQRKRKTNEKQAEQPDEQQDEESQPRKRGRKATQHPERPQVEPEDAEPAPRKKRQRKVIEPEPEEHENRRSPRNSSGNGKRNVHGKSRRVQNPNVGASQEDAEQQQPGKDTKKVGRRKGGKPSADSTNDLGQQQQQQQATNKKRRGSKDNAQTDSDESLSSPQKPYLHVAPFKRTIRSSHIAAKWSPLSGLSLPTATSILTLAQRPILQRTATTRNRRTHATAALNLVSRRIERKLARGLPFPPASSTAGTRRRVDADGGRAMELDFEAVLDGKQALDRQLQPAKHAVKLLKAEKDRMEKELEKDYEELRRLEANARAQTRERKDLLRKAHILAPTSWATIKHQDTEFVTDKDEGSLKDLVGMPLEPLALQLAGHVDSIRGNLQQAEGVMPQLDRTKAALQDVLQRYLDADAYEHVLFG